MAFGQSYKNQTNDSGISGFMILTGEAKQQGYNTINLSRTSQTVVRVVPEYDHNTGKILPYRYGNGIGEFTNWIVALETAVMGITGTISFICQLADPSNPKNVISVQKMPPPPTLFHQRMKRLVKEPRYAAWHVHLQGETGKAASIQPTSRNGFMNTFLCFANGKVLPQPLAKQILVLRKSARQAIEDACMIENPHEMWGNDPNHPNRFRATDFTSPEYGRVVRFAMDGFEQNPSVSAGGWSPNQFNVGDSNVYGAPRGENRGNQNFQRYNCIIDPPEAVVPVPAEIMKAVWKPWEELLQLHSAGDQVLMMARVIPKEMLIAALGDEEYFPASLKVGLSYSVPAGPIAPQNTWGAPNFNVPTGPVPGYPTPNVPGVSINPTPNPQYPEYAANTGFPPAEISVPTFFPANPGGVPASNPNAPAGHPTTMTFNPAAPYNPPAPVSYPSTPAFNPGVPNNPPAPVNPAAPTSNPVPAPYNFGPAPTAPAFNPGSAPAAPAFNPHGTFTPNAAPPANFYSTPGAPPAYGHPGPDVNPPPSAPGFNPPGTASVTHMNVPPTAFNPAAAPPPPAAPTPPGVTAPPVVTSGWITASPPPSVAPNNPPAPVNPAAPAAPGFNVAPGSNPAAAAALEQMRAAAANVGAPK